MNRTELHQKLIVSARRQLPSERVPLAFEKRVMARLRDLPARDEALVWVRALWCGATACAGVALLVGIWSFFPTADSESSATFSQEFEQTILASVEEGDPAW